MMFSLPNVLFQYREQQQLFMYDWDYLREIISQPGGFSTLAGRLIVQYFNNPAIAIMLTALLALITSIEIFWIICNIKKERTAWPIPFCVTPSILMLVTLSDINLHFDYYLAILTAVTAALIHSKVNLNKPLFNASAGIAGTVISWFLAGPAVFIFALCALVIDQKRKKGLYTIIYPLFAFGLSVLMFLTGHTGEFLRAATSAFYYEVSMKMPLHFNLSWIAVPLVIAIAAYCRKAVYGWTLSCLAAVAAIAVLFAHTDSKENRFQQLYMTMELLAADEKWEDLSSFSRKHLNNYKAANYYNLAQAKKGTLADNLFKVAQAGPQSLIHISSEHASDICLAHVLYAGGNMAGAQNIAFNALQARCGYNPTLLKMLTKIELMRGSYEVAEKYLNLLSKAPRYSKWAERYKTFLYNDSAVEADPELGRGRRSWPEEDGFANSGSPFDELHRVMNVNPEDRTAMEYALSYLLLAKDINSTCDFIDRNGGKPSMRPLPTPAQEALVFFSEYYSHMDDAYLLRNGLSEEQVRVFKSRDIDWCRAHGLTQATVDRFESFKAADSKTHDGRNLTGFQDTFWYYLLYTKI